jgi:hypothetical protein
LNHTGEYFVPENVDALVCPFVFVYVGPDECVEFFVVPAERVANISTQEREDYLLAHPKVNREQPRMIRKIGGICWDLSDPCVYLL